MARLNLMTTIEPVAGEQMLYAERPQWFKDWENTGLLKFEDKKTKYFLEITIILTPKSAKILRVPRIHSVRKVHSTALAKNLI